MRKYQKRLLSFKWLQLLMIVEKCKILFSRVLLFQYPSKFIIFLIAKEVLNDANHWLTQLMFFLWWIFIRSFNVHIQKSLNNCQNELLWSVKPFQGKIFRLLESENRLYYCFKLQWTFWINVLLHLTKWFLEPNWKKLFIHIFSFNRRII